MKLCFKDANTIQSMNHRGGNGCTTIHKYFSFDEDPKGITQDSEKQSVRFAALIELEPYASINEHDHPTDEEVYIVISGQGIYTENGQETPIGPQDILILPRGESHGIKNTQDVPLVFYAVIAQ